MNINIDNPIISYSEKDFEYLIRRINQRSNSPYHEEILSKMWEKIELDEFKKVILLKKHVLFSLDNWNRNMDMYF